MLRYFFVVNHDIYLVYNRVLATYRILLGWKTYQYYYGTVELPNPGPTHPKKNEVKAVSSGSFFFRLVFSTF